ncbi:MAG: cupin domain-containing protein [Synechococcaceae cyanobacterium]
MPPSRDLEQILAGIQQRSAEQPSPAACRYAGDHGATPNDTTPNDTTPNSETEAIPLYHHRNAELAIDFRVRRLPLAGLQVMDPRLVRIAPGARNECHRHAHESIFVVLSGEGELRLGSQSVPLKAGDVASVPRWLVHQSRNTSAEHELLLLAITDFGLTSAVLGDYDRQTRLKDGGADAFPALAATAALES